ncbi:replication-relaxation family protein [Amycolatopsis sp. La24]|uniref:replication-relaxation family protein n=1 Tax=Amycolatopsis sp. La24 TaxID=3028304 RepID=UPI0023B00C75|nr:replication-relaxation family protein [Amycolatopsis sp. La24]
MLHEHKVLTTGQIVQLCYPSVRAANHRLLDLYKWRVLDRFQPFVTSGTAPMHYVLDIAGSVALAYEDGLDPKQVGYRHEDAIGIAHSLRLAHTVGVNGFFTSLVAQAQQPSARGRLTAWWSERRCVRLFGDMVRPDSYGRWREEDDEVEFFLEFDFGTEDLGKLTSKLHGYEKLAAATGITTPVLVWLPTSRREANARTSLADTLSQLDWPDLVPIATSAADVMASDSRSTPASTRWLPISSPTPHRPGRLRLIDLAQLWPQTAPPGTAPSSAALPSQTPAEITAPEPFPPPAPALRLRR